MEQIPAEQTGQAQLKVREVPQVVTHKIPSQKNPNVMESIQGTYPVYVEFPDGSIQNFSDAREAQAAVDWFNQYSEFDTQPDGQQEL